VIGLLSVSGLGTAKDFALIARMNIQSLCPFCMHGTR
jgi:hypothetical protein